VALFDGSTVPCFTVELTTRGSTVALWLTDDARRLPVQLSLPLPYGTVMLVLSAAGQQGSGAAGP
jgi:hypothetical protein